MNRKKVIQLIDYITEILIKIRNKNIVRNLPLLIARMELSCFKVFFKEHNLPV